MRDDAFECLESYGVQVVCRDNVHFSGYEIPIRFFERVARHLVPLFEEGHGLSSYGAPVFLAIFGVPGCGKTFQTVASCLEMRATPLYCSASSLTGSSLGDSANAVTEIIDAAIDLFAEGMYPVLILDDFHLSESSVGEGVKTTINSSLLTGRLMNLCDAPQTKIPVIFTANSLSSVYPPLLRDGRTSVFEWNPTLEEKKSIVRKIVGNKMNDRALDRLMRKYGGREISFFSAVVQAKRSLESLSRFRDIGYDMWSYFSLYSGGISGADAGITLADFIETASCLMEV